MAQNPIFTSKAYSVFADRVEQGQFTAKAISATEITSNYKSSSPKAKQETASAWKLSKNISAFPIYQSDYVLTDALYNLALEEMQNAIEPDSTFRTGKEWGGVWTRDISYSIILSMAILQPEVAMHSLMRKVKDGRVIQDTGTGGAYPVSSDRMIWAVAAWEVYKVTGDKNWLKTVYPIIKKSVAEDVLNIYDIKTGLVRGESSFLDWREQTYPRWMQPADIYESECLGTNAVHYQVNIVLAEMAKLMDDEPASATYSQAALKIKQGIQANLWQADKNYFGQYLYGRDFKILSPKSEALGEALVVLFDAADTEKQAAVIAHTPVNDFGVPCIYAQIPGIPPYHNKAVWPFVETYFGLASAKTGNENSVLRAMSAVYRPAALFLTNKENFVASTGDYAGTEINSSNMLWSLSGNIALVYKILFGMKYQQDQLEFKPFVPEALKGKRNLKNFKYRHAMLDITLEGFGNEIKTIKLDGKMIPKAVISADLTGTHQLDIILSDNYLGGKVNLAPDEISPETPVLSYQSGVLSWPKPVGVLSFKVIKNGNVITRNGEQQLKTNQSEFASYQIIGVTANGTESFATEPWQNIPTSAETIVQAEKFAKPSTLPYKNYTGIGFVEISKTQNTNINFILPVKEAGTYTLDFRYANGNGPINTENKCAIRSLMHENQFLGTFVFPQRGTDNWNEWGYSNAIKLKLKKGDFPVSLNFSPANENMNGEINQAMIDQLRLVRIGN